jgi:hypothetical protein
MLDIGAHLCLSRKTCEQGRDPERTLVDRQLADSSFLDWVTRECCAPAGYLGWREPDVAPQSCGAQLATNVPRLIVRQYSKSEVPPRRCSIKSMSSQVNVVGMASKREAHCAGSLPRDLPGGVALWTPGCWWSQCRSVVVCRVRARGPTSLRAFPFSAMMQLRCPPSGRARKNASGVPFLCRRAGRRVQGTPRVLVHRDRQIREFAGSAAASFRSGTAVASAGS